MVTSSCHEHMCLKRLCFGEKKIIFFVTDVSADVKQQEIKGPVAVSCVFL